MTQAKPRCINADVGASCGGVISRGATDEVLQMAATGAGVRPLTSMSINCSRIDCNACKRRRPAWDREPQSKEQDQYVNIDYTCVRNLRFAVQTAAIFVSAIHAASCFVLTETNYWPDETKLNGASQIYLIPCCAYRWLDLILILHPAFSATT